MQVVQLFAAAAAGLLVAFSAAAEPVALAQADQAPAAASSAPDAAASPGAAPKTKAKKGRKKKSSAATEGAAAPADAGAASAPDGSAGAAATGSSTSTKKKGKKSRKSKKSDVPAASTELTPPGLQQAPTTPPPAPVAAPEPPPAPAGPEAQTGADDNDAPSIAHSPVTKAMKGKSFVITARITDPSGVFQPVLYLRKRGLGTGDFIPIRMVLSKLAQGEYAAEVPPALVSADLEYYLEAFDNAGNGPARAGGPESPLQIKVEEEKKIIINQPKPAEPPPLTVTVQPKGAPPAISHTAVTKATKGSNIEINARLIGDTGVTSPTVLFRKSGETAYKALPMGDLGGDNFTATIPATMATGDLEYYLEAFDKYGNGPGRSGAPSLPYRIQLLEPVANAGNLVSSGRTTGGQSDQPRLVKAPFKPNPGRAAGWLFMGGFVGAGVVAAGEGLGAWQNNNEYTHTFEYEGRDVPELRDRANAYGKRAKTALIISGASLAVGIVLLLVFPEHPDTIVVGGSGGDAPGTFHF